MFRKVLEAKVNIMDPRELFHQCLTEISETPREYERVKHKCRWLSYYLFLGCTIPLKGQTVHGDTRFKYYCGRCHKWVDNDQGYSIGRHNPNSCFSCQTSRNDIVYA